MADHTYRAKGVEGRSGAQIASDFVDYQRQLGKSPGTIRNMGRVNKELAVVAFKQFGVYSRAVVSKPQLNKHQLPKGKL
jgi:hypothetical protein